MKPTSKSPTIDNALSAITGKDRPATIIQNKCMMCNEPADEFKDEISKREYRISGMCQVCQDKIW